MKKRRILAIVLAILLLMSCLAVMPSATAICELVEPDSEIGTPSNAGLAQVDEGRDQFGTEKDDFVPRKDSDTFELRRPIIIEAEDGNDNRGHSKATRASSCPRASSTLESRAIYLYFDGAYGLEHDGGLLGGLRGHHHLAPCILRERYDSDDDGLNDVADLYGVDDILVDLGKGIANIYGYGNFQYDVHSYYERDSGSVSYTILYYLDSDGMSNDCEVRFACTRKPVDPTEHAIDSDTLTNPQEDAINYVKIQYTAIGNDMKAAERPNTFDIDNTKYNTDTEQIPGSNLHGKTSADWKIRTIEVSEEGVYPLGGFFREKRGY